MSITYLAMLMMKVVHRDYYHEDRHDGEVGEDGADGSLLPRLGGKSVLMDTSEGGEGSLYHADWWLFCHYWEHFRLVERKSGQVHHEQ